jgi:carbon storage regulator
MLVLSRKENQQLTIGDNIVVRVVRVEGGRVRLGIEDPAEVPIRRQELASRSPADDLRPQVLAGAA